MRERSAASTESCRATRTARIVAPKAAEAAALRHEAAPRSRPAHGEQLLPIARVAHFGAREAIGT